MPELANQNININSSASTKKSPWPMSFVEENNADGYIYSEWELEEIRKKAKAKFAEVASAAASNDKFIKDGSFVEKVVNTHHMPGIIFEAKEKFQKASSEYEKKLAEDAKKASETKAPSNEEKSFTIDEVKTYLETNGKDSIGSNLLPQIRGMSDGKSSKSAKLLGNGIVIVKYDDIKEFDRHVANAINQGISSDSMTSLVGTRFKTLVSVAEISSYGKDSLYKQVISDSDGVRVNTISKKTFEGLINNKDFANDKTLTEAQKSGNREKFSNKNIHEVAPERTLMDGKMKDFLLRQCKNDDLFGFIPVPGIPGGRKDRLKARMKNTGFTFSKEDGVVVEKDSIFPNRVTVTINGNPDQDTFIPLTHGCAVKVGRDGKIVPDTLFKIGKNGSVKEIDIKGGIFRLPLFMRGNLVNAMLADNDDAERARSKARDVMEKYKKLELIVCKDEEKKKENVGLSFLTLGKSHGLWLTDGEKIATTISAGLLSIGFGFATAGAGTVAGAATAGVITALSGAATIKGATDVVEDKNLERVMEGFVPTGGAQRAKSENFQNITNNQRT